MKLKRNSDGAIFNLVWPTVLPTNEQLQEHDMAGLFITINLGNIVEEDENIIYAPFSKDNNYTPISEEGDLPWTI